MDEVDIETVVEFLGSVSGSSLGAKFQDVISTSLDTVTRFVTEQSESFLVVAGDAQVSHACRMRDGKV